MNEKNIRLEILYQDEDIIVVNKPAGLQVHPVKSRQERDHGASPVKSLQERDHGAGPEQTLTDILLNKFPEIKNVGDESLLRPGIVHRLDKDTSGVMVIARNQETFEELKNKFKNREITKKYWAIAYGVFREKQGIINKPIARSGDYRKQTVAGLKTSTKIRPAMTKYKVLKEWDNYSLVEVTPKTGRMHQIRVHLTSIGHPIVGDEKYKLKNVKIIPEVKRQLLHAKSIEFDLKGKRYSFETEVPDDFNRFLKDTRQYIPILR